MRHSEQSLPIFSLRPGEGEFHILASGCQLSNSEAMAGCPAFIQLAPVWLLGPGAAVSGQLTIWMNSFNGKAVYPEIPPAFLSAGDRAGEGTEFCDFGANAMGLVSGVQCVKSQRHSEFLQLQLPFAFSSYCSKTNIQSSVNLSSDIYALVVQLIPENTRVTEVTLSKKRISSRKTSQECSCSSLRQSWEISRTHLTVCLIPWCC